MKQALIYFIGFGLLAVVIAVLPFTATNYLLRLTTICFMYIALSSSWNIVGGTPCCSLVFPGRDCLRSLPSR